MDKNEFTVGEFFVDMKRNKIHGPNAIMSIEPKVLEVLLVLSEHQGEVVSHEQVAQEVWPNTVVAPSALQRCIAQLRKAFGDDAKRQAVIQTHPKKGYSLISEVTWKTQITNDTKTSTHRLRFGAFTLLLCLILLITMRYHWLDNSSADLPQLTKLTPLTSTDKPEFYSAFSPNGQFIAFSRHSEVDNHGDADIWVRDLTNEREYQVTQEAGHAGEPAWSQNSSEIAFILDKESESGASSAVYTIRFGGSLAPALSKPIRLHDCQSNRCSSVQWLDDDTITFIESNDSTSLIVRKNLSNQTQSTLFERANHHPYSLSYSAKRQQLAIMMFDQHFEHQLLLVDVNSNAQTHVPFSPGKGNNFWSRWPLRWNANHDGFITSTSNKLLHVDLSGQVVEQSIPTYKYVLLPEYHPDGERIALTLGYVDRDISEINWNKANQTTSTVHHRSFKRESFARFKPNSEEIAFISDRSGHKQLWLGEGKTLKQLSQFNDDESIVHYVWSPGGTQIAALVNQQLRITHLDRQWENIELPGSLIKIFQWLPDNTLLLATLNDDQHALIKLNLNTGQILHIRHGFVRWAQQTIEGKIVLTTKDNKISVFNQHGIIVQNEPMTSHLTSADIAGKFLFHNNAIYWLSSNNIFSKYELTTGEIEPLFTVSQQEAALGDIDINNNRLLITHTVSTNKEIVLLHH